jgi:hypothetical protein
MEQGRHGLGLEIRGEFGHYLSLWFAEALGWSITNPQGFSVAGKLKFYVDPKKEEGVYRIIIFGGSTVEGYGILHPLENLQS